MKRKEPILETERLILRPLTVEDAEDVFDWASDERVTEYMAYPTHKSISDTQQWLAYARQDEKEYNWGFVLKKENKLIGSGSIGPDNYMEGYWGFGYNVHYEFWNKGYTTEAMRAIIAYAHDELGVERFCACHAVENPASGRVMEKCGLQFHHNGKYSKADKSKIFDAKYYTMKYK